MKDKTLPTIHITGAGVISVDSSKMFATAKGKLQLLELKKIHDTLKQKRSRRFRALAREESASLKQ